MTKFNYTQFAKVTAILFGAAICSLPAANAQVLGPRPAQSEIPAASDWRSALANLKLKPAGELERRKHHSEIEATTEDGRRLTVTFDQEGRVAEIEDEDHEHSRSAGAPSVQVATDAARRAGFLNPSLVETRKRHVVVRASTIAGETVDLHVDNRGWIYRQVWVRS